MLENALSKLLEVRVVDVGLGVGAILVDIEPAALVDGLEDAREALLLLGQVDQEANDQFVDLFGRDLRGVLRRVVLLLGHLHLTFLHSLTSYLLITMLHKNRIYF